MAASTDPVDQDPNKATTLKQLELDRRERQAADALTEKAPAQVPSTAELTEEEQIDAR